MTKIDLFISTLTLIAEQACVVRTEQHKTGISLMLRNLQTEMIPVNRRVYFSAILINHSLQVDISTKHKFEGNNDSSILILRFYLSMHTIDQTY